MTTQRCFPLTEALADPKWRNINERCKVQDAEILALQDLVLELDAKVLELVDKCSKRQATINSLYEQRDKLSEELCEQREWNAFRGDHVAMLEKRVKELEAVQAKLASWANMYQGETEDEIVAEARRECGLENE